MKIGDKIMAEGEITQVGQGFVVVRFPRVGAMATSHVRVATEACHPVKAVKKHEPADRG